MLVRLKTEEHTEDRGPTSVSPPEKWNSSSTTDSPALYRLPPLLSFISSGTASPDTPVASSTTPILAGVIVCRGGSATGYRCCTSGKIGRTAQSARCCVAPWTGSGLAGIKATLTMHVDGSVRRDCPRLTQQCRQSHLTTNGAASNPGQPGQRWADRGRAEAMWSLGSPERVLLGGCVPAGVGTAGRRVTHDP